SAVDVCEFGERFTYRTFRLPLIDVDKLILNAEHSLLGIFISAFLFKKFRYSLGFYFITQLHYVAC
ncbi:hypothetical protein, partial [Vibrio cholerae]|uniref:hypothetical protein n=1 Tax=Vibrio cholerae TaxID=666 RepID=UPI001F200516